jgi:hypothetical protein
VPAGMQVAGEPAAQEDAQLVEGPA